MTDAPAIDTREDIKLSNAQIAWRAARCFDSADYLEGRKAFAEKRKPVFRGQ